MIASQSRPCTSADVLVFFFQAEDGIRDLVRSRGLGDVYKRQAIYGWHHTLAQMGWFFTKAALLTFGGAYAVLPYVCLLYTSDAADERSSVDLGGRRIIKKKKDVRQDGACIVDTQNKKRSNTYGEGEVQVKESTSATRR